MDRLEQYKQAIKSIDGIVEEEIRHCKSVRVGASNICEVSCYTKNTCTAYRTRKVLDELYSKIKEK